MRTHIMACTAIQNSLTESQKALLEINTTAERATAVLERAHKYDEEFISIRGGANLKRIIAEIKSLQGKLVTTKGQLPGLDSRVSELRTKAAQGVKNAPSQLQTAIPAFQTMTAEVVAIQAAIEAKQKDYLSSTEIEAEATKCTEALEKLKAKHEEIAGITQNLARNPGHNTYQMYLKFIEMFEGASENPEEFEREFDAWMDHPDTTLEEIKFYKTSFSIIMQLIAPEDTTYQGPRMRGYYIGESDVSYERIQDLYGGPLTCVNYDPFLEILQRSKNSRGEGDQACQCCFKYDKSLEGQRVSYQCDDGSINKTGRTSRYNITTIAFPDKKMVITLTQEHGKTASVSSYGVGGSQVTITIKKSSKGSKLIRTKPGRVYNGMYDDMPRLLNVDVMKKDNLDQKQRNPRGTNITLGNLDISDSGSRYHLEIAIRGFLESREDQ